MSAAEQEAANLVFEGILRVFTVTTFICIAFAAVNTVLTVRYLTSRRTRNDPWRLKILVYALLALNLVICGVTIRSEWALIFAHRRQVFVFPNAMKVGNALGFFPVLLGQSYYVDRVYRVSHSWPVLVVGVFLTLVNFGTGLTQFGYRLSSTAQFGKDGKTELFGLLFMWASVVTEAFLVSTFVFFVARNRKGFSKNTDRILAHIIKVALESAAPTLLIAFSGAIIFSRNPSGQAWVPFFGSVASSYNFSVLYSLLSRADMRDLADEARESGPRFQVPVASGGLVITGCTPPMGHSNGSWAGTTRHSIVSMASVEPQGQTVHTQPPAVASGARASTSTLGGSLRPFASNGSEGSLQSSYYSEGKSQM